MRCIFANFLNAESETIQFSEGCSLYSADTLQNAKKSASDSGGILTKALSWRSSEPNRFVMGEVAVPRP